MPDAERRDADDVESRRERTVVLVGGGLLTLGIVGFVAFSGGRGTGSAAAWLGHPELTAPGLIASVGLVVVSVAIVHWSEKIA